MPRFKTVSNKGKGSRSKPKALKPAPAELQPEPPQVSPSDSGDVALDGEDGKKDISNGTKNLLDEKMLSGSVVSGLKENDQNALEGNGLEKEVAIVLKVDTDKDGTGEGTIDDGEKLSDGDHLTTNLSVEDNEVSTDNLEEYEAPLKFDNNGCSTGDEMQVTTEDVSADSEALNMTDNFENDKESSKFDADKPVGTISGSEVKVVTGQVTRPKRKVIKKKLVKKPLVQRNAVPHLSDENNASEKACEVDAHEHVNTEEKASYVNYASNEACKAGNNEHVSNEEEPEVKPSVTVNKMHNRIRKKKAPQSNSGLATIQDTQNPQSRNGELGTEKPIAINEADVKINEMEKSVDKASPLKSKKKHKEGKSSKKVDSMGMIFMCSSETKKDCFRYKVLGLPATKKDMVLKIYKGMRLFLFDVDLRMMYGIFKAAGPGGYNIEPRAFKSQFPSQVRFSILEDSVPLAEERFKKVLKDNYYSNNKFNFQLNHDQVKNLCKLFHEARKKAESTKAASRSQRTAATSSTARRDTKRKRVDDNRRVSIATSLTSWRDNKRRRVDDSRRVAVARPPPIERERSRRRNHKETRRALVVVADRYPKRPSYERETYVPPVAPVTIYQPLPPLRSPPRSRTYSYDRVLEVDPYRRETVIDNQDLAPSRGLRLPIERSHYDSYLSYREPPQVYSERVYDTGARSTHYDYTLSASVGQYAEESEYYRSADYRLPAPPLPLYRRY